MSMTQIPWAVVECVIYTLIVYFFVGFHKGPGAHCCSSPGPHEQPDACTRTSVFDSRSMGLTSIQEVYGYDGLDGSPILCSGLHSISMVSSDCDKGLRGGVWGRRCSWSLQAFKGSEMRVFREGPIYVVL